MVVKTLVFIGGRLKKTKKKKKKHEKNYTHCLFLTIKTTKTRRDSPVDCRPSTAEAPQRFKIHPISKMAVTFEPVM